MDEETIIRDLVKYIRVSIMDQKWTDAVNGLGTLKKKAKSPQLKAQIDAIVMKIDAAESKLTAELLEELRQFELQAA